MKAAVIVAAAGRGTRMETTQNKQYLPLLGKPVLTHSLTACFASAVFSQTIVVITPGEEERFRRDVLLPHFPGKSVRIVPGGKERQDSVCQAVQALDSDIGFVCIHDGARPLATPQLLAGTVDAARRHGAAIAAVPVKDTVKIVDNEGIVRETPPRNTLFAVHTPQAFRRDWLEDAYNKAYREGYYATDDAALLERYGYTVRVVMSDYENIKVTTPDDLILAETLLGRRQV